MKNRIGPSGLSQSMGHLGRPDAPEVQEAMDGAFAAIVAAGKVPGSTGNAQTIRRRLQQGVRYLYTHVPTLLASGSREFLAATSEGA